MVIDPAEGGSPVIHGVEIPVLEHDVTSVAAHMTVVETLVVVWGGGVSLLGGRGVSTRDVAAQQQRQTHHGVDEPAQQPHSGEPAR